MKSSIKERVFGLDLMRAIAILMVVFGHSLWIFPPSQRFIYQIFVLFGFFGVEIFFVLSGFLIGKILYQTYIKEDFSFKQLFHFLKRRWFRTLPNYFLILLLNIVVSTVLGYSIDSLWKYFLFLQNFNTPMLPFFTESWSLSVEEFAYIVLPIFLLISATFSKPKNKSRFFLFSVLALILIFFCNKIYYQYHTTNTTITQWNASLKSVVLYRLDSIFIGVLCSWIYCNYASLWQKSRKVFFVLGVLFFMFLFVGIGRLGLFIETHSMLWNVFYLPFVSITVACFLPFLSEWKEEKNLLAKPITFISIISYSIYLLHYSLVLQLMKHYFPMESQNSLMLSFFLLIYFGITITLSYLLYRFFEKPMMDLRDKN
ncbi:acyltransferase family protein [Flavobacterium sp. N1994]|uniref:acyltransferase family protein n=1 Tax=Flavobacterium sp. N1994 TaxID=2986827 RepID=UPI00222312B1|nr:acyltransferase [Flavobacterium sp. N1994]